ncbi:GntR family transcriptional regulator [Microbacterium thalassium]|uniref:DNA-binding GntR family transcriptional regulator n=1 Tax=Microbacterium thalassium TaxID=362649 RepID=A0A7X0FPE2_9MICO|nr:GntR family transcriptional regulator [Microbacterium thalassium]MBB6390641.1 DNA-binding GntR family transcriptional regulator [Microbacterium thalassium]GLK25750.1 GntR family transcriptional regulator [Microbacterium thalassium]
MEHTDAAQQLTDRLRADLTRGEYHPRERLVESDLVERYGFPRGTVRTALVQLQAEGLIDRMPHKGAMVRSLSLAEAIELAEVRRELEVLCAREAARRGDSAEREQLAQMLAALERLADAGDMHGYRQASLGFHEALMAMSRHTAAVHTLATIRNFNLQQHFPTAFRAGSFAHSAEDHRRIGEAVLAGDAELAEEAMRRHLDRVVLLLRDYADVSQ